MESKFSVISFQDVTKIIESLGSFFFHTDCQNNRFSLSTSVAYTRVFMVPFPIFLPFFFIPYYLSFDHAGFSFSEK